MPAVWEEEVLGEAVVLKVFRLTGPKAAAVGGCRVKQGKLIRNATFRVLRDGEARYCSLLYPYILFTAPPPLGVPRLSMKDQCQG